MEPSCRTGTDTDDGPRGRGYIARMTAPPRSALPPTAPRDLADAWGGRSRTVDLDGPVHWVDFGGPAGAPPVVLVHGLGGSHLNWVHVAPALAAGRRVVAVDLAGFGLTPGTDRLTTVNANAALLARFIRTVLAEPAVLVGNSMGGMVSILLAARLPQLVAGLVLVDPSLPSAGARPSREVALQFGLYATPLVGERFLLRYRTRYSPRQRVIRTVRLCFADPDRADQALIDAGTELTAYRDAQPGIDAEFLATARSLLTVLGRSRSYAGLIQSVDKPVLLVHGALDRLVPVGAARAVAAANPSWETAWLDGVGHTPQLETPDRVLEIVTPWLARLP